MSAAVGFFVPHAGCTQRCSFCNQRAISGAERSPAPEELALRFAHHSPKSPADTELAFFGGSFTALPLAEMRAYLAAGTKLVREYGLKGLRFSTRPDALGEPVLNELRKYPVTTVELGAQSMDDAVLSCCARGHSAQQVREAARAVRREGYGLVLQMMTGLPGDTELGALSTARELIALAPNGVRIYPTLVLRGSDLALLYERGGYTPQTLEQAVRLCGRLLSLFADAGVPVIKLGLHASTGMEEQLLAGPYHPAFRELVEGSLYLERALLALPQEARGRRLAVEVAPRCTSRMAGHGGINRTHLMRVTGAASIAIRENCALEPGDVRVRVDDSL